MVRISLFILTLCFSSFVFGQVDCEDVNSNIAIGRHIQNYPIYEGIEMFTKSGLDKFYSFIQTNLVYPEAAKEDKIEGQVIITFLIDSIGVTSKHSVYQGVREDLDSEALRVAKLLKFDEPAKDYYGKPTVMCFTLPISFSLDDEKTLCKPKTNNNKGTKKLLK